MYTILHNSRCGKSRDAVNFLEESGIDFKIREYLKEELTFDELKSIINDLKVSPLDIIRTNELIWKENYKNNHYSDDELIQIMVENPKLIQRPIVLKDGEGVVGRPLEMVANFVKK